MDMMVNFLGSILLLIAVAFSWDFWRRKGVRRSYFSSRFTSVSDFETDTKEDASKTDSDGKRLYEYVSRKHLFTPAEKKFLDALSDTIQGQYAIFGKVRVSDIADLSQQYYGEVRMRLSAKTNQKHIDFVICHPVTLEILGVIELDDSSHQRQDRIIRDELIDHVMKSAGLPILRVPVRTTYSIENLRNDLQSTLMLTLTDFSRLSRDLSSDIAA